MLFTYELERRLPLAANCTGGSAAPYPTEAAVFVRCGSVPLMYNLACRLPLSAGCTGRQAAAGQRRAHAALPVGRQWRRSNAATGG